MYDALPWDRPGGRGKDGLFKMLRYLMLCLVALGVCSPPALAVYDATSGQWLTRDPAKYVDGPNLYRYGASGLEA